MLIEYDWERDDSIVSMAIEYSWSKPVPASYLSPSEGGTELDCITATAIRWDEEPARVATVDELTEAEQAFDSDKAWDIACEDAADREDNARESAAEARAEWRNELRSERGY